VGNLAHIVELVDIQAISRQLKKARALFYQQQSNLQYNDFMTNPIHIFDVDGVLITGKMFSQHLEDDYGISKDKTMPFFTTVFNDCLEGRADLQQSIQPYLKDWKWQGSVQDFLEYWFTAEHIVDSQLIGQIQNLRQKGIRAYVATNQEKYRTEYLKTKMGFSDLFDGFFSSADLGCKKPSERFFELIVDEIGAQSAEKKGNKQGVKKNTIWFFDDTLANVEAAQKFGINGVHYTNIEKFIEVAQWV